MRAALEHWLLARWFGRPGLLWLAWPLELLYRAALLLRPLPSREHGSPPVIVVGNLAAGGSGKTPLVLALAAALRERGLRAGVISRGYGGSGPFPYRVHAGSDPAVCGDEPLLLARRAGIPVVVHPQRAQALAVLAGEVDVVISDDGLQHRGLPRCVEIAVIDGRRGLGNGHCLPVGPLREPPSRLERVDFRVANGTLAGPAAARLSRPVDVVMELVPCMLRRVSDPAVTMDLPSFIRQHAGVHAVAGIGDPERFFITLRAAGLAVTGHPFPDHHRYTPGDFRMLAGEVVVMTEKDAVKCAGAAAGINAWYLEVEARLPAGFVDTLLARAGLQKEKSA